MMDMVDNNLGKETNEMTDIFGNNLGKEMNEKK